MAKERSKIKIEEDEKRGIFHWIWERMKRNTKGVNPEHEKRFRPKKILD